MKSQKLLTLITAAGALSVITIGGLAQNRGFEGVFEAAMPKSKNSEEKIARITARRIELETKGQLTTQARRQSDLEIELLKLSQAGTVARLSLRNGIALLDTFPRPALLPPPQSNLSYTVSGFGPWRKIHFEPLDPKAWICPPDDFLIESPNAVVSKASKQKFTRVN